MTAHIELNNLSLVLNHTTILRSLSLRVARGERVALIGPSGAGKTSLLRVLATEYRTQPGLLINGMDVWQLSSSARQKMRRDIGLIWQKPPLPNSQSVLTAVQAGRLGHYGLWRSLLHWWQQYDRDAIAQCLQTLGIADKLDKLCGELSGGQLQRVGIARVLYQAPALMLADEPVASLDPVLSQLTVQLLLQQAQTQNSTLICSLHAVDLALRYFPRIIGLRDGQIVFDGDADTISRTMLHDLYAGDDIAIAASPQATTV